ncbi:MAG: pyruvate kinase [Candidatus Margulisbacteria bacterium]|nr:pyruvate kinase [Candidatus Margulisiibacteriota bacterium]
MDIKEFNHTKIIATLGPATESPEKIRELIKAGVDVFRLNTSHGTMEEHGLRVKNIRKISEETEEHLTILVDLQGPKIRVGNMAATIMLKDSEEVTLIYANSSTDPKIIPVDYEGLFDGLKPGERILLNDGRIELKIKTVKEKSVLAIVINGGELSSRKGINVPGATFHIPAVTERDKTFIKFAVEHNVDYIAQSFVRTAGDVLEVRKEMAAYHAYIPVIAKIEKPQAIENIDDIINVADGIMVARGDLGVEMSPEEVPLLQKMIIQKSNLAMKPVIVATQMLESMIEEPVPTRAETNDVANAILDGGDAVMLSAETTVGKFPIKAVEMMNKIAATIESSPVYEEMYKIYAQMDNHNSKEHKRDIQITRLFNDLDIKAIIAITTSGYTARLLSKAKVLPPIIAVSNDQTLCCQLNLLWGVIPYKTNLKLEFSESFLHSITGELKKDKLLKARDKVIVLAGLPYFSINKTTHIRFLEIN